MTLRLCAWIAHGLMDGVLLGTASHLSVLIPRALALLICAVQDVAGLYIYFTAREANARFVMVGICVFSAAFPLGTCISFALFRVRHRPRTPALSDPPFAPAPAYIPPCNALTHPTDDA